MGFEVITKPTKNVDEIADRIFKECINVLGGLRKIVEYRNLTWLPSLAEASYVVAMKYEGVMTSREIAEKLGITQQTVKNILEADEKIVEQYLRGEIEKADEHIAGGIAKLAYKRVKENADSSEEWIEHMKTGAEILCVDWAVHFLTKIKGTKFPITSENELIEKVGKIKIMGKDFEDIAKKIAYPIKNPAELLHKVKECLQD